MLTRASAHEFHEDVERVLHLKQAKVAASPTALALDSAHSVAFHTGLGAPMYPTPSSPKSYLDEHAVADFALAAYTKGNIALVADGASQAALSRWAGKFFDAIPVSPAGDLALSVASSTYHGGEQRAEHARGNAMVIAFPSSSSADLAVLAALLGGPSSVKWSPGSSILGKIASAEGAVATATNLAYSDAGLLAIQISGPAKAVRKTAEEAVKALKAIASGSISKEDVLKATAKAKFDVLEKGAPRDASLLSVGTSLVHGQKLAAAEAVAANLQAVTAEKLTSVSALGLVLRASPGAIFADRTC
jgi:ubiquinol-cytochrome c reductase core subunit 2